MSLSFFEALIRSRSVPQNGAGLLQAQLVHGKDAEEVGLSRHLLGNETVR